MVFFSEVKKMEPLPLSVAHPKAYIVEERLASLAPWGDGRPGGPVPGGARGVQFSSASHGLNAVCSQFVLPLEAAQKGPFFRAQSLGRGTHFKLFFF